MHLHISRSVNDRLHLIIPFKHTNSSALTRTRSHIHTRWCARVLWTQVTGQVRVFRKKLFSCELITAGHNATKVRIYNHKSIRERQVTEIECQFHVLFTPGNTFYDWTPFWLTAFSSLRTNVKNLSVLAFIVTFIGS